MDREDNGKILAAFQFHGAVQIHGMISLMGNFAGFDSLQRSRFGIGAHGRIGNIYLDRIIPADCFRIKGRRHQVFIIRCFGPEYIRRITGIPGYVKRIVIYTSVILVVIVITVRRVKHISSRPFLKAGIIIGHPEIPFVFLVLFIRPCRPGIPDQPGAVPGRADVKVLP